MKDKDNPIQIQFGLLIDLISKQLRKEDGGVEKLADAMGLSKATVYGYLARKTPDVSRCEFILEYGTKLLEEKGVDYSNFWILDK